MIGTIALVWGTLDTVLRLRFGPSLATMLIVIGVAVLASLLVRPAISHSQTP